MKPLEVAITRLPGNDDISFPAYATEHAAGMDLAAAVTEPVLLEPGQRALVPTGFAIALPEGFEAQVRPRSGLAARDGITVLNAPGTIDADYRGEIKVPMINHGERPFRIERGMRIAQMIVAPVSRVAWCAVKELPPTERGDGGFGSTGVGNR